MIYPFCDLEAKSQPIRIPDEFPDYYPQQLWARTEVVIVKAVENYPTQAELNPLVRFVVAHLTPDFCRQLRSDLRLLRMRELVRWLVTSNCRDSDEQKQLVEEIRRSKEWLALAEASVERSAAPQLAASSATQPETQQQQRADRRKAALMPLLQEKGWTPSRLATEAGVGKNSVTHYLDGRRKLITLQNRQALADALGVNLEQIPE